MKKEWREECTAKIVATLLHDNGYLNRLEPKPSFYISKHAKEVLQISDYFEKFMDANPELYTDIDNVIEEITIGEESENQDKYGGLVWWEELNDAIDKFFDAL